MKDNQKPEAYRRGSLSIIPPNPLFSTDHKFHPTPFDFYKAQFDVWIPHLFVAGGKIPCPKCMREHRLSAKRMKPLLQKKGFPSKVRRIVDIERIIYLIGYRYYCGTCSTSYTSYNSDILSVLPRFVAAQFTHPLTYRTGITDSLATLLRSCMQHAIGPGPFAQMIDSHHRRRYDLLHIQYLHLVKSRSESAFAHLLPKFEPFGDFADPHGYG